MTNDPSADDLDNYERLTRDRLSPVLGPFRTIDRRGGPPGLHDFEVDLEGGLVAAIEVTGIVDSERLGQAAAAEKVVLSLPGSESLWLVSLDAGAQVRPLKPHLLPLLADLEAQGR